MQTPNIKRMLVALGAGHERLPRAAVRARVLAQALDAELTLFRAVHDAAAEPGIGSRQDAARGREAILEAERGELDRIAYSLRDWGITVNVEVRWGAPPHEIILEAVAERDIDLLVVGPHAVGPSLRWIDTDWQLMQRCPCPVLVVKESADGGPILAAVDPLYRHEETQGTDRAVLGVASLLASSLGVELGILHAYPDPRQYSWVSAVEARPGVFYGEENIEAVHREAIDTLLDQLGCVPGFIALEPGEPQVLIPEIATARQAQLLVLGLLKRGAFEQAMLGSTAERALSDVPCDILAVKPRWAQAT